MQLFSYLFNTAPVAIAPPDWDLLSRVETEKKVVELLDSKNYTPLFSRSKQSEKYFDQIHPISEDTQVRLAGEVPGWVVRDGFFYGAFTVYPEKILLACLSSPNAAEWIANPDILTKQATQTRFIIAALGKFPELVLNHPLLFFKVDHSVFHSEEFALAVSSFGGKALFAQDEDGDTFLFNRFITEETVAHIFHALGRKDFGRLVTMRNKEKEHFAYSYNLDPETIMAVINTLPKTLREEFVAASSKKGNLFTKTPNGSSKEVKKWLKDNKVTVGRVTRSASNATKISDLMLTSPSKEMWETRGSPKI